MTKYRIRWAAGTALVIATMALAACSSDDSKAATTPTKAPASAAATSAATTATTPTTAAAAKAGAPVAEGNVRAVIVDFILPTLTVKVGSVVEFVNQDTTTHTATSDDKTTFDSKALNPGGGSFKFTATKAGTYTYACMIHSTMTGSITVQ